MRSDYPYNDDLLNTEEDQARARSEYEPIAFALIFPTLISKVADADQIANRSKRRLREKGLLSVALVTRHCLLRRPRRFIANSVPGPKAS